MKRIVLVALVMTIVSFTLNSCFSDEDNDYLQAMPSALVTVKPTPTGCYFQLDDSTTLMPSNLKKEFGDKEVRALVRYVMTDQQDKQYGRVVNVSWINAILTKEPVAYLDTPVENDAKYGNDAIDIVRDWVTIAEDGYLTLRFRALWGNVKPHSVNLLVGGNSKNPYEVELRHNVNGDPQLRWGDALVAFYLNDVLPDTHGRKVKMTIKWKSSTGDKSISFDYCSRKMISGNKILDGFVESTENVVK